MDKPDSGDLISTPRTGNSAEDTQAEPATEVMIDAYLTASDDYWRDLDAIPPSKRDPSKWRNGTPREATRAGLNAVFALSAPRPAHSQCAEEGTAPDEASGSDNQPESIKSVIRKNLITEFDFDAALNAPGCERLKEWASIGPVQRAALEQFVDTLRPMTTGSTPELPGHPEPHTMTWTALERERITEYGRECYAAGVRAIHQGQQP